MSIEKTMHTLGRICRMVWPETGSADTSVTETIAEHPANGFGVLCATAAFKAVMDDPTIVRLINSLPTELPNGPMATENQGPFYLGFFQQANKLTLTESLGADDLRKSGEALFGSTWQSELARQLGINDSRRVWQWLAGDRPIPAGIWLELAELAKARGESLVALSQLLMRT